MWRIISDGTAVPVIEKTDTGIIDPSNAPRQQLPQTYYQDGYVDIFPIRTVLKYGNRQLKEIILRYYV
jgi:hypothetical protein